MAGSAIRNKALERIRSFISIHLQSGNCSVRKRRDGGSRQRQNAYSGGLCHSIAPIQPGEPCRRIQSSLQPDSAGAGCRETHPSAGIGARMCENSLAGEYPRRQTPQEDPMAHLRNVRLAALAFAVALIGGITLFPAPAAAQQPYHVAARWKIGGAGRWDYMHIDAKAHHLYIAHGDKVDVIDTRTGKSAGSITGLHGTHGIALDTAGKYGYISDGGGDAVVVFNRKTLAKVATIPAGQNPDGITFEPVTQTVWAFNGRSNSATVISAYTNMEVATITLPGRPEFPVADGKGNVYDNITSTSQIARFDAQTKKITALWPIGCNNPSGLAIDTRHH